MLLPHAMTCLPCLVLFSCDNISTLETNLFKENEKLKIDNAKLVDEWKRYTKGYEKANEMMIHQALSGDFKGFSEAIKKHNVGKMKNYSRHHKRRWCTIAMSMASPSM